MTAPNTVLSIEFLAADTSCNTYAYGTRGGGVQLTRDGGKTWTSLDPGKTLPARPVNSLAFDPTNSNILYAALSSFDDATPATPGHVFKTTNAMAATPTWTNTSPALNQPFNVIAVDLVNPLLIYAGSDTGLWRSTDGAKTWSSMSLASGLPPASIYDIKIKPATGRTVAFTYGRGAYALVPTQTTLAVPSAASPAGNSGPSQTFTFTFSDLSGWQNLNVVDVLIASALDGRQACYVAFVPSGPTAGSLYLVDDAGDAGGPYQGTTLPGNGSVANSQCTVSNASAAGLGNTFTLTMTIAFASSFAGNKLFYLSANDKIAGSSGWQALATWNVPGAAVSGSAVTGMSPARSSGATATYAFAFTDTSGWQDIAVADILINSAIDGRHACFVAFAPASSSVFLVDDAGDAGGPYAGMVLPSSATVSNSQCTINGTGSSVIASGNTLTLNLSITFSPSFAGNQVFFLAAGNNTLNSGWQAVGSVTVPSAPAPSAPASRLARKP